MICGPRPTHNYGPRTEHDSMKEVHLYIMHLLRRSLNYQEQVRPSLQYKIADDAESSPDPPPLLTKQLQPSYIKTASSSCHRIRRASLSHLRLCTTGIGGIRSPISPPPHIGSLFVIMLAIVCVIK